MFQVFWAENGGGAHGSLAKERYYILFLVPKDTIEHLLDTMRVYIEHHKLSIDKRSKRGPNLTGGAITMIRRSVSLSPEPSMGPMWRPGGEDEIFLLEEVDKSKEGQRNREKMEKEEERRSSLSAVGEERDDESRESITSTGTGLDVTRDSVASFSGGGVGVGVHVPKVIGGSSRILTSDDRINIAAGLPFESRDYNWQLEYSSNIHGLSWHTLHRCIANAGPNIVVVRTTEGEVLGGYATQSWVANNK